MPSFNDLPDVSNIHMDDSTTSLVIFVIVALVVFAIFKKLFKMAVMIGLIAGLVYFL